MTNNKLEWFYSIIRLLKYFFIRINNLVSNKVLIKIIIAELMFLMILRIEYNAMNITSIISNIITVSGIFAGIVIAYLLSKIFQIRGEREQRKVEIDKYSKKLTSFRKLLHYVMNSYEFWVRWDDIKKFENQYKGVDFDELHNQVGESKNSSRFWLEEKGLSRTTVDLYQSMKAIFDNPDRTPIWVYDRTAEFNYSIDQLRKYYEPSGQIQYYLQGRYAKHTHGLINDKEINRRDVHRIREHASSIDSMFRNQDVDRNLIANVANEFYEIYIPKLLDLTILNHKGMSSGMKQMVISILMILLFGVVIPLLISITPYNIIIGSLIIKLMVSSIVVLLLNFISEFISIMNSELLLKN